MKLTAIVDFEAEKPVSRTIRWKDEDIKVSIQGNQITAEGKLQVTELKSLIYHLVTNVAFDLDQFHQVLEFKY